MTSALGPYGAPFRKISSALYLVSALLIFLPIVDFLTGILPFLPTSTKWRFASSAVFAGSLLIPLIGIALAMVVAGLMNHRFVLRWVGILSFLAVFLLICVCALLALDIIELRSSAESEVRNAIVLAGARAVFKNLLTAASLVYIGLACRSASGGMEPPRAETPMAPIVGAPRR